jgi:hypothetical protein
MKRSLLIALLLVSAISMRAQLPNGGFETWTNLIFFEEPQGYLSSNYYSILSGAGGLPRANVFKSTTVHSGTYAAKLESYADPADNTRGIPGGALTGVIDLTNVAIKPGFAYTDRPSELRGYYKYTHGQEPDTAIIGVVLYKRNAQNQLEPVGGGTGILTDAATYTSFSIPILYTSSDNPDTAVIGFSTSIGFNIDDLLDSLDFTGIDVPIGSVLYIDELSFFGIPTGVQSVHDLISGISSYPNPAKDRLTIEYDLERTENIFVRIYNPIGQLIKSDLVNSPSGKNNIDLAVEGLEAGIYYYQLMIGGQQVTQKFVVVK